MDEDFTFGGEDLELSLRIGRRYGLQFLHDVEIIHYGRASSRQHRGYVEANMAAGHVRFLRKLGYSNLALWVYKLAMTVDLPLLIALKSLEYLGRRLRDTPPGPRRPDCDWKLYSISFFASAPRSGGNEGPGLASDSE